MSELVRRQILGGLLAGSVSASTATGPGTSGKAASRPWLELLAASATSVLDFIPERLHAAIRAERCGEDLAPYINAAVRAVLAQPSGGTLFFPRGAYPVSEIDATNSDPAQFSKALSIVGEGRFATSIRPAGPGAVLLNAAGRNNMMVQSIQFLSADHESQAAIYLCRTEASPNCNGNRFFDVLISGNYRVASVVSIAAESTSWTMSRFENVNTASRHCCFATSNRPQAVPVRTRATLRPVASSNTDNVMADCEFYAPFPMAAPLLFAGSAAYVMQGCTVITGEANGSRLATYRPDGTVFNGPVTWNAPHFEVFGRDNIVHFLDAPANVSYFRSINSFGGNYVVGDGTTLLGYDRSGNRQPVLMASTWAVPSVPWNVHDIRFETFGLSQAAIDFRLGDDVGAVDITGYAADSRITAARRTIARFVTNPGTP
ncbi:MULTISPECIES: hypothetical protein [unclassified Sphingomonas]|uniref:hypothetical protein n=1 Tax=unclassified Sphingomonas TaxID=196159 RepID=UPI00285F46B4|nr:MULTISPECIES: hypothetical protein [unclassified Sphingomonas]MDR6116796.1 hypothetical protein [Sphingomonas sp. SORGH_AS_0789]MDR6151865.1 hypothetical protein [Sphingomonas sp. SORGH_AS_0742]